MASAMSCRFINLAGGDRIESVNQSFARGRDFELPRACASTFNKYRPGAMSFNAISRVSPYAVQWAASPGFGTVSRAPNTSCPLSETRLTAVSICRGCLLELLS